ncbi:MAG: zinc-binding dehydrogenase [Nitrospinota bacterium]
MRAAILKAFHRYELGETDRPAVGPEDLLVRVHSSAICGTDLAIWAGKQPGVRLPLVGGHEATGVVEEVGENVVNFRPGERVVLNPTVYCGKCYYCRRRMEHLCERGGLRGREVRGTYADYVEVPETLAYRFPESVAFDAATNFIALYTCIYGQRKLPPLAGKSVVVIGQGVTGLLHTQLAKHGGADPVIAVARSPWKLDLAKELGADETAPAREKDPVAEVRRMTEGRGADIVIESAGSAETIREAFEMVRAAGTILQFGIGPEAVDAVPVQQFYFKDLTVIGTRAGLPEDFEMAIKLVSQGHINLRLTITDHFPFQEIQRGFEFVEGGEGKTLRAVIDIAS